MGYHVGIRRPTDDFMEVWLDDKHLFTFSRDDHGWHGMIDVKEFVLELCERLGIEVSDDD